MQTVTKEIPNFEEKNRLAKELNEKLEKEIKPLLVRAQELGLSVRMQGFTSGEKSEVYSYITERITY